MKWDQSAVREHPYEAAHYIQKLEYAAMKVVEAMPQVPLLQMNSQQAHALAEKLNALEGIIDAEAAKA